VFYEACLFLTFLKEEDLIFGICEANGEEKEPECLMLGFHIVESLARVYRDPSGLLASSTLHIYFFIEHLPFIHSDSYTSLSQLKIMHSKFISF